MSLQISLAPETEAKLRERAAAAGKDPVEFAREALEEKLSSSDDSVAQEPSLPPNQRVAEVLRWIDSHQPVGHFVDDSRESIYEGRGE